MRRRCQRNSVSGVTSHPARLGRGSAAAIAASKVRSVSVSSGRSTWRRNTASWWRNTIISRFFERPDRTVSLASDARNRYKIRYTTNQHRPASRQANDHGRVSGTHRVPIIRSWALTRGFALHPGTRNRYEIRDTRTQHRPPSRQANDHGRVSGTHRSHSTGILQILGRLAAPILGDPSRSHGDPHPAHSDLKREAPLKSTEMPPDQPRHDFGHPQALGIAHILFGFADAAVGLCRRFHHDDVHEVVSASGAPAAGSVGAAQPVGLNSCLWRCTLKYCAIGQTSPSDTLDVVLLTALRSICVA